MNYPNYPPPQYPNQPYMPQPVSPQYAQPQPPPVQVPRGTIDDFYGQPAAAGKAISFNGRPPGTTYTGVVIRNLTDADVITQTDMITRQPARHPDGSIKRTLVIPLQMQPSPEFPDGTGAYYVKSNEKADLDAAMQAAGLPHGSVPEQGGILTVTFTREVQTKPGLNPRKEKRFTYQPPANAPGNGAAISPQPANTEQQPPWSPSPESRETAAQTWAPGTTEVQVQPQPVNPAGLSPDQLRLLETLRGQQ